MPDKYCITGGSGFIGTRLIDSLHSMGFGVQNIDKKQSAVYPGLTVVQNIMDLDGLNKSLSACDIVVHLAAEHRDDVTPVSLYYDVNVTGTRNLLNVMEKSGIKKIIFTSTVAVYGLNKDNPDESWSPDPFNHYGTSKLQAEELIRAWQSRGGDRCAVILRPSVIFGEGNRGNVYNLLRQISSGKFLMIGNGQNTKSMAYVGNVSAFIFFLAETITSGFHIYNYTDLPDLSTNELVGLVRNELGVKSRPFRLPYIMGIFAGYFFDIASILIRKKFNISAIRIKKFCSTTRFNSGKAHGTGFLPPFGLEQALRETIHSEFYSGESKINRP